MIILLLLLPLTMLACDAHDHKENDGTNQYKKYSLEWRDEVVDGQHKKYKIMWRTDNDVEIPYEETVMLSSQEDLGNYLFLYKHRRITNIKDITKETSHESN